MEIANIIIALAALVISAVVPFLSVYAAQRLVRREATRKSAMDAFLKINQDTMAYRHALLAWHPANSHAADPQEQRQLKSDYFDAFSGLRSNCLSIGLIFGNEGDELGKSIQDLYATAHAWTDTDAQECPTVEICEAHMNSQIKKVEQSMRPLWESI